MARFGIQAMRFQDLRRLLKRLLCWHSHRNSAFFRHVSPN
jgi:hypothetical protein